MSTQPIRAIPADETTELGFDEAMDGRVSELLQRYPTTRAALLPILWLCQERWGWVPPDVMRAVAARIGESPAFVEGVVTFYTMYFTAPPAQYVLQVCTTLSCDVCGARELLEGVRKKLGIGPGERTPDGRFQVIGVQCLGACGNAPVIQINDDYFENLTPGKLDAVLDELGRKE